MARQGPLVSRDWQFRPPSVGRIIGGGRGVSFISPVSTSIPRRAADVLSNPRSCWRHVLRHDQRLQQACSGMACTATATFYKGILVAGLSRGKARRVRWSCALRTLPKHRIPKALLCYPRSPRAWSAIQAYGGEGIESEATGLDAPR